MSYDGPNRRRWWMRPWRVLRDAAAEFGKEPEGRWHHVWRDFVPLLAILLAGIAVFGNESKVGQAKVDATVARSEARAAKATLAAIQAESRHRRDQNCLLFERQEEQAVVRVIRTYEYLDTLRSSSSLTRAIIRGLSDAYRDAKAAKAPRYCDRSGVGLAEPQPKLPKPPRQFKRLLRP